LIKKNPQATDFSSYLEVLI